MITERTFNCSKCGKQFVTKGNVFNQFVIVHYSNYKFILHCMAKHRNEISIQGWLKILKQTLKWIPLLIIQAIQIIRIPAFVMFYIYLLLFWILNI